MWASNAPATSCMCNCMCDFFVSVVLVVPQPITIHVLNQLTSCSIQLNSLSYASRPGETTSIFSHFKSPCQSEKLKVSSWVINLVQAMTCSISLSRHLMGATFFFFFSRGVVKRCFGMLEMHCKPTKLVPFVGISACLKCIASLHSLHVSQS